MSLDGDDLGDEMKAARATAATAIDPDVGVTDANRTALSRADGNAIVDHLLSRGTLTVAEAGTVKGSRATLNFVSGATVADNSGSNRIDVTVTGGGGGSGPDPYGSTPSTINAGGSSGSAGSSDDYARGDHEHPVANLATQAELDAVEAAAASAFGTVAADLAAHIADTSAAHAASAIGFTPAAGIGATDVQAAIVEDAGDLATHAALTTTAHGGVYPPDGTTLEISGSQIRMKDAGTTNAKLANMAEATIKGRAAAAGTGVPTDLTATQVKTILAITPSDVTGFDESAQDAVGTILADSATIDHTYNDGTPSITSAVIDDSITDAKLRNSAALSVIGRSANSSGDPADIAAAVDGDILRRKGTALAFGVIPQRPRLGELLFDLTDVNQLDAPTKFQRNGGSTGGGNGDTAATIGTTTPTGNLARLGTLFRVTVTALAGGAVFGVKTSSLTLPEKYVIYMEIMSCSVTNLACGPMLFYRPSAGDFEGCMLEHTANGGATASVRPIVNDQVGATNETIAGSGAWSNNSVVAVRGGKRVWCETCRQQGDATALASVRVITESGDNASSVDGSEITAIAAVGTNWNNENLNRVGIAISEAVNGVTATFDFKKFQIYAHPWD